MGNQENQENQENSIGWGLAGWLEILENSWKASQILRNPSKSFKNPVKILQIPAGDLRNPSILAQALTPEPRASKPRKTLENHRKTASAVARSVPPSSNHFRIVVCSVSDEFRVVLFTFLLFSWYPHQFLVENRWILLLAQLKEGSLRGTRGCWEMLKMTKYLDFFGANPLKYPFWEDFFLEFRALLISSSESLSSWVSWSPSLWVSQLSSLLSREHGRSFIGVGGCPGQKQSFIDHHLWGFFTPWSPPTIFLRLLLNRETMWFPAR